MKTSKLFFILFFVLLPFGVSASTFSEDTMVNVLGGKTHLVTKNPTDESNSKGVIYFFHGHGDRAANHVDFFETFSKQGYKLVGFDLPGHGDSEMGSLDKYSFEDFFTIAAAVVDQTLKPGQKFYFVGWSLGGLVAYEFAQHLEKTHRTVPEKLILWSPAFFGRPLPGKIGRADIRLLTQNSQFSGSVPKPQYFIETPLFTLRLLAETMPYQWKNWELKTPTLVLLSEDAYDYYVDPVKTLQFLKRGQTGPTIGKCDETWHALDFEPAVIQRQVFSLTQDFLQERSPWTPFTETLCHLM